MAKKLHKSKRRMLLGVCGGLAEYLNIDPTIVRLATIILTLIFKFWMVIVYVLCGVVFPERHIDDDDAGWTFADEELKSANIDGEKIHKNEKDASGNEAENARQFAEHADQLRTDSEFDSFFKK